MKKQEFVSLARAATEYDKYERELLEAIKKIAKKYKVDTDFIGLAISADSLMTAICQVLGDDFAYFLYECDASFEKMSENIVYKDGTHPKIENYEDLYEFTEENKK